MHDPVGSRPVLPGVVAHEREAAALHALAERTAATLARLQLLDTERRLLSRPIARLWRHCR